jgi:fused signal recognition particle receptor
MAGLWRRLMGGLLKNDAAGLADVERILLEADFGVAATTELVNAMRQTPSAERQAALEAAVVTLLGAADGHALARAATPPTVILVFGVNGVGKTTTVAKLARRLGAEGRKVLLAASDTFRAGATSQLRIWAERLGVPCVGSGSDRTGDPAAVAFDAIDASVSRGCDTVIVDTAGRLHTEAHLLDELKKVVRVVGKRTPGAPHESLLVLDGSVGQNAVQQATAFSAAIPLTGLIVTKLDGTARGGSVVAVRRAVPVPIRFIGTGEGFDDLQPFDAASYAHRLVAE